MSAPPPPQPAKVDDQLVELVRGAHERGEWKSLVDQLIDYADWELRRYWWRGHRVDRNGDGRLAAAGKTADEFVVEAIEGLLAGTRAYRYDMTLQQNIRRSVESGIWSWKKSSDRKPLLDRRSEEGVADPIDLAVDLQTVGLSDVELAETLTHQRQLIADCEASLKGDAELLALFDAYKAGYFKPAEIEDLTDIPAGRVSELKRKMIGKMDHFRNHPSAQAAGF